MPMTNGLDAAPAMPTELISAMPAGRAADDKIAIEEGRVQKAVTAQKPPTDTKTKPRKRTPGVAKDATSNQPVAAISMGRRMGQGRSFLQSELLAHNSINGIGTSAGTAAITPVTA